MSQTITDWPESERPREKLLRQGAATLSDAELLAIFLRTGTKGMNALELARQLLCHFGSLNALLNADQETFCQWPGLGLAKYCQLQAVIELAQRYLAEQLGQNDVLQSPEQTKRYLQLKLKAYPYEVFACLFLNKQNRIIAFEELFRGSLDRTQIHPREIIRRALHHNAAAVILSHNHPSGQAQPSEADRRITLELKKILDLIEVRLLDHMIIAHQHVVSLAEMGLLYEDHY